MAQLSNWKLAKNVPSRRDFEILKPLIGLSDEWDDLINRVEADRSVVGVYSGDMGGLAGQRLGKSKGNITVPETDAAKCYEGWGTALKPACEDWWLLRNPLSEPNVAANVLKHGTGALNIDGCRIQALDAPEGRTRHGGGVAFANGSSGFNQRAITSAPAGRWPANLLHDGAEEVLEAFARFGYSKSRVGKPRGSAMPGDGWGMTKTGSEYDDEGSPARFFYCAKAGKADRQGTTHPTTKPISLISWLCRLICPPGGVILDCFAGSGSIIPAAVTQGFKVIAIEREEEYISDCLRRIEALKSAPRRPLQPAKRPAKAKPAPATLKAAQGFLFNFSEVAA